MSVKPLPPWAHLLAMAGDGQAHACGIEGHLPFGAGACGQRALCSDRLGERVAPQLGEGGGP